MRGTRTAVTLLAGVLAAGAALALAPTRRAPPEREPGTATLLESHEVARWRTRPDGRASELVLHWPEHAHPRRREVTITARASAGPLVHRWSFEAGPLERGRPLPVTVPIPDEAGLSEDHVVDLLLTVHADGAAVTLEPVWLAWPDGLDATPVVWTPELGETLAPHGLLDPELVALADALGLEGRVLPALDWGAARRPAATGDGIDTGLRAGTVP